MKTYKKTHENKQIADAHIAKIKERGGIVTQTVKNGKILVEYSFPNQNSYIEKTYSNLIEKKGHLTTKTDWFDKQGIKRLQYGFDPFRNEEPQTLFYYSWDFKDSKMGYDEFIENLKKYFENKYNKKVKEIDSLYVGWDRKEKGTY